MAQGSTQTQAERLDAAVLGALAARRWRMSADIADETGLPAPTVRLALRRLRDRGVLDRNIRGEWQIIAAGGTAGIGVARR
jgi:DNA-binding IclR family transcriptional regulator